MATKAPNKVRHDKAGCWGSERVVSNHDGIRHIPLRFVWNTAFTWTAEFTLSQRLGESSCDTHPRNPVQCMCRSRRRRFSDEYRTLFRTFTGEPACRLRKVPLVCANALKGNASWWC